MASLSVPAMGRVDELHTDVCAVGAGPAGLALSLMLLRSGVDAVRTGDASPARLCSGGASLAGRSRLGAPITRTIAYGTRPVAVRTDLFTAARAATAQAAGSRP